MVIVFDLDDTLYDELTYVESGFHQVAAYIEDRFGFVAQDVFDRFWRQLAEGRDGIFDAVLEDCGVYSKRLVKKCVSIYRTHRPSISLWPAATSCLQRFSSVPVYIVTDGNKTVQRNKLIALGLYESQLIRFCYLTYRYGRIHSKPSSYCFLKIAEREGCAPQEIAYIGDNPRKDFVGLNPLGFLTIRVLTGQHGQLEMPASHEARHVIENLDQLSWERMSGWLSDMKE